MRDFVKLAALSALVLLPGQVAGQNIWVGAGATFPVSDYGNYANTGFLSVAGVGFPVGEAGLRVIGEGFYGQNNHEGGGEKTSPFGVMGGLEYDITGSDETKGVYLFGQAGVLVHRFSSDTEDSSSSSGFGYGAGAGVFFPLGGVGGWIEGRAMNASIDSENTSFFGIMAGLSFDIGGGS